MNIAVLLPTWGKPEELDRIADEVRKTSVDSFIYAYVADDDPKVTQYREPSNVRILQGPNVGFSGAINALAGVAASDFPRMLMRCEDDFYFNPGWEEQYLATIPDDEIMMTWCWYKLKGPDAEPHTAAITARWYHTVGYFSLPGIRHFFCDNALRDLGNAVGRARCISENNCLIEHRWNPGDARKGGYNMSQWGPDEAIYLNWRDNGGRDIDAKKLREVMR